MYIDIYIYVCIVIYKYRYTNINVRTHMFKDIYTFGMSRQCLS